MSIISDGAAPPTRNNFVGDVWITLKRWLIKTTVNPLSMVFNLFQPVIFLVLFTGVFGEIIGNALTQSLGEPVNYVTYLVPAIVIQSAFFTAGSSGGGLTDDMETGMFEKVLVMPINRGAMFLGKTLSEVVRIVVQTLIILALGYILVWLSTGGTVGTYIATGILGAVGIVVVAVVFAIWFAALSNIFAIITGNGEATVMAMMLLQFPLLFLSTAFLPLGALSGWVQTVAKFNPVTYGVDATRALMLGQNIPSVLNVSAFGGLWGTVVPAVGVLAVLGIVFGSIAVRFLNKGTSP